MKSAYELAMERLEKSSGPAQKLTDDQKKRIAEIDNTYDARVAENKLGFDDRIAAATTHEELESTRAELSKIMVSLEQQREQEKEAVWNES